jgi:hypothetical protein
VTGKDGAADDLAKGEKAADEAHTEAVTLAKGKIVAAEERRMVTCIRRRKAAALTKGTTNGNMYTSDLILTYRDEW